MVRCTGRTSGRAGSPTRRARPRGIQLVLEGAQPELVGPGKDISLGIREGVEPLQGETVREPSAKVEICPLVVGEAVPVPSTGSCRSPGTAAAGSSRCSGSRGSGTGTSRYAHLRPRRHRRRELSVSIDGRSRPRTAARYPRSQRRRRNLVRRVRFAARSGWAEAAGPLEEGAVGIANPVGLGTL